MQLIAPCGRRSTRAATESNCRVDLEPAAVGGDQRNLEPQIAVDFDEVDDATAIEPELIVGDHENGLLDGARAQRAGARKCIGADIQNVYAVEFLPRA